MPGVVETSTTVKGHLAVLSAHLGATKIESFELITPLEPQFESSQNLVQQPCNLKGSLTIVDERIGKRYQIQVTEDGTVKTIDFKKGKSNKGLKLYDSGYLNTAPVHSMISYIDGELSGG